MFVCQAGVVWGGGGSLGVLVVSEQLNLGHEVLLFYIGRVMCVGDPVFGSVGSGNIISV